jgi:hypothetical protein
VWSAPRQSILGPLLFNIFINDLNGVISESSLRLYAYDMNGYNTDVSPMVLKFSLNNDLGKLSNWLEENYLLMNPEKTQSMILGKSNYNYEFQIDNKPVLSMDFLCILGMIFDKKLTFKDHVKEIRVKACAKIGALRRLKRIIPVDIAVRMYKTFVSPQLEYCNPALLGIGKTLTNKLESTNCYGLRTLLGMTKNTDYRTVLEKAGMNCLEHRRYSQSLVVAYKCFTGSGSAYIREFLKECETVYNLRNCGTLIQPVYNNLYYHNSFTYIISHVWNKLPQNIKCATTISRFKVMLKSLMLEDIKKGCTCSCNRCLS